jgi:hypothetical protein
MLFKPEDDKAKIAGKRVARGIGRRFVSLTITLLILGGLGYLGWNAFQQKQGAGRGGFRRCARHHWWPTSRNSGDGRRRRASRRPATTARRTPRRTWRHRK